MFVYLIDHVKTAAVIVRGCKEAGHGGGVVVHVLHLFGRTWIIDAPVVQEALCAAHNLFV
jgi:hypothetical protein